MTIDIHVRRKTKPKSNTYSGGGESKSPSLQKKYAERSPRRESHTNFVFDINQFNEELQEERTLSVSFRDMMTLKRKIDSVMEHLSGHHNVPRPNSDRNYTIKDAPAGQNQALLFYTMTLDTPQVSSPPEWMQLQMPQIKKRPAARKRAMRTAGEKNKPTVAAVVPVRKTITIGDDKPSSSITD